MIKVRRLLKNFREFENSMSQKNISAFSASTAFFLFLSLIPMLVLICAILPYTSLTEENFLVAVMTGIPHSMQPLISSIVKDVYSRSAGILSVAVIGTLWSAGRGVLELIRGLNAINDVEENRNYFLLRIVSSVYTLIMIVTLILSLVLMVFGNSLVNLLFRDFPQTKLLFGFLLNFRFIFSWAILTLVFTMIYTFIPNRKQKFSSQLTGGMFSAIVWSVFSWCFSIYIDQFNGFSVYGSLTTIIIVMLYLYFCMYIVMIGAYINSFLRLKGGVKQQWEEWKED